MNRSLLVNARGSRASLATTMPTAIFSISNLVTIGSVVAVLALLLRPCPAFAQSASDSKYVDYGPMDSSLPDTAYAVPAPDVPLADPSNAEDAISEANPGDDVEPFVPVLAMHDSSGADTHSGWDRIGDVDYGNASDDSSGKVLEVPQVVSPADGQPIQMRDQVAEGDLRDSPDQVGSIDDYQGVPDRNVVYAAPVETRPRFRIPMNNFRSYRVYVGPMNPGVSPGFVAVNPPGIGVMRPIGNGMNSMNSAIMPTSPMFPNSPGGGWWTRAR